MVAVKLLIISFLVPREFTQYLGELSFPMYRIVLIILFPYVLWLLYRKATRIDWNVCDVLAIALGLWPIASFAANTGWPSAFESGGSLALDLLVPYFLIRATVNNYDQRKLFATMLCFLTGMLALVGLPESILGVHFIHDFAAAVTGNSFEVVMENRYGIWRAVGPTDHAIIFGTLCASSLAMAVIMSYRQPIYLIAVLGSAVGSIISASTAPILVALVQAGMLGWDWLVKSHLKWLYLLLVVVFLYVFIDVASSRDPFRVMFTYLLLNPQTGYARYEMWTNAYAVSTQTLPGLFLGYGYDPSIYEATDSLYLQTLMAKSVDSMWLVFLFRHGIVMISLLSLFLLFVFHRVLKQAFTLEDRKDRRLMMAFFISAFAMTLISATVHYWSLAASIYMMILAVCVGKMPKKRRAATKAQPMPASAFT